MINRLALYLGIALLPEKWSKLTNCIKRHRFAPV